jgi:hypothetical protein
MNALSVAWKLRVDMLAILAAAAPHQTERSSDSRLIKPAKLDDGSDHDGRADQAGTGKHCEHGQTA